MPALDEDFSAIREGVRSLCAHFDDSYWRGCDEAHRFPWDFYNAMAAAGWIGIAIPEEYGGAGCGVSEASVVMEEVAASGAGMNGCSAIHLSVFGTNPIVKHGSESMRRKYLPEVAHGNLHVAFGVTEPDAGTDTTNISTRAVPVSGGYLVHGRKIWTTKASVADRVLLLVRTTPIHDALRRVDGMTLLFADLKKPEVTISPISKVGRNAIDSSEVVYDGLFVDDADRVGEEGKGFSYLLDGLNAERILLASEALGLGKVSLMRAVRYANQRVVFGRPIGKNQGIAFPLSDAYARLHAAELCIRHASRQYDLGQPCGEAANIAKLVAADAGYRAADQAVQTLGGMGYAKEYDVERYWREARLLRLAPVSQEMVLNYLAEHSLGLPRSY